MKHNFEERKANRIEYAEQQAVKNEAESNSAYKRASELGQMIPLGQPILVGHHSERGHRAHLKKIDNAMRRSVNADAKAKYYTNKADAIENNTAIFSDDPNAIEKLQEKVQGLEKLQELMKATNKVIRKFKGKPEKQFEALQEMGFAPGRAVTLTTPDFCGRIGFASYKLTNNNANITRIRQRIAHLQKIESLQTDEVTIGDVRIVQNVEANRVQILFPSIPSEQVRKELKGRGFRWCRSEGAWQRHLNGWAMRLAKEIVASSQTKEVQPI